MSLESVRDLIPLPDEGMVPPPELFLHPSYLHGQAHVARVMIHALRLIEATGAEGEASRLWAAVYLHDIARRHDGSCKRHGADAWARLATLPDVRALFTQGRSHLWKITRPLRLPSPAIAAVSRGVTSRTTA